MEKKIENIIKKLQTENVEFQKALDKGLSKYNTSRTRQSIKINKEFIKELEQTLS